MYKMYQINMCERNKNEKKILNPFPLSESYFKKYMNKMMRV